MLRIRRATKADLDDCLVLLRIPELKHASGVYMEKKWLVKYLGDEFLVADIDGQIVGVIYGEILRDSGSLVWGIAVSECCRGKGVGGRLLDEYEKVVRKKKAEWVILYGCAASEAALRLYSSRGYDKGQECIEFVKEF